jgi:hypothetical protein
LRRFAAFNARERDATRLHHCDHVSRHHDGPRANRVATEWSDSRQRKHRVCSSRCTNVALGTNVALAIYVIALASNAVRHGVGNGGIANCYRIGERCNGDNRLRLADISITFTIAGGNTGHIHTGGEHDCDGSQRSLTYLPASGPLNGWRLGKPERNSGRVAWWMLRLEKRWLRGLR